MENSKPISTPWEVWIKITKTTDTVGLADKPEYHTAVGCLTHLMNATRQNIAAAVNKLSQFGSCPRQQHWSGVKRVLSGTRDHGLVSNRGNTKMEAFSVSYYEGCLDTYCSRSGFCLRIGDAVFDWRIQKLKSVSFSTTKAQYIQLRPPFKRYSGLRSFPLNLAWVTDWMVQVNVDSKSAIQLCKNRRFQDCSKHIGMQHSFFRKHAIILL